jgi:lipopolysaccharide export system permease protein
MHTLHRHVFLSVLLTCAAAAGMFAFILLVGNAAKDLLDYALAGQLSPGLLGTLLLLLVPYVLPYALPLGVLTGVLLVLGRMSAQQEVTALRAAGLGPAYLARPVVLLGALLTVLMLGVNYDLMPRSRTAYRHELTDAVRQNPLAIVQPKTFVRKFPNIVFYVGDKQGNTVRDVWVWRLDSRQRVTEFIRAAAGQLDYDEAANTLQLTLTGGVLADRRNPLDPEDYSNTDYQVVSDTAPFPPWNLDRLLGPPPATGNRPTWMTLDQLLDERRRLAALPPATDAAAAHDQERARMRVNISLHEKGASSLTVLAFALMAVPLGIRLSRRETTANLSVAVGLALSFYLLNECIHWFEKYPALHPDLLLWVPPLAFIALGTWLLARAGRV